ncbi:MAG: glycosyltransferase [Planctomycetota bacterium]
MSVVIAAKDAAAWIEPAVRSILMQDFDDLELIVMDDGSMDDTAAVVRQSIRGDNRARLVEGPARGVSPTRNAAMEFAQADLIAVMDADDIALPHRLRSQVAFLDDHPEVAILGGWMRVIDEAGAATASVIRGPRWEAVHPDPFRDSFFIAHPTALMRRDVFEALGGYRESMGGIADSDLWARAIDSGYQLDNLQDVLLLYRRHASQSTVSRSLSNAALMGSRDLSRRIRARGLGAPFDGRSDARIPADAIMALPADLASDSLGIELAHRVASERKASIASALRLAGLVIGLGRRRHSKIVLAIVCLETAKAELLVRRLWAAAAWGSAATFCAPRYVTTRVARRFHVRIAEFRHRDTSGPWRSRRGSESQVGDAR